LGKEDHVEQSAQVPHARSAPGAALEADHALDRGRVAEAPLAKRVLEVDELLGELVEVPMLGRVAIDVDPRTAHRFVERMARAPVALDARRVDGEAAARKHAYCFIVE